MAVLPSLGDDAERAELTSRSNDQATSCHSAPWDLPGPLRPRAAVLPVELRLYNRLHIIGEHDFPKVHRGRHEGR